MLGFNPRFGGKSVTLGQTGVGSRVRGEAVCQEPSLHVHHPPQGTLCPPSRNEETVSRQACHSPGHPVGGVQLSF